LLPTRLKGNLAAQHGETQRKSENLTIAHYDRARFLQLDGAIEHPLRHFPFAGFGNADGFVGSKNGDGVSFRVEADALAGDIVRDNRIERFRNQLLACVLNYILGFSRESDHNL